jgi:hypothetical protein
MRRSNHRTECCTAHVRACSRDMHAGIAMQDSCEVGKRGVGGPSPVRTSNLVHFSLSGAPTRPRQAGRRGGVCPAHPNAQLHRPRPRELPCPGEPLHMFAPRKTPPWRRTNAQGAMFRPAHWPPSAIHLGRAVRPTGCAIATLLDHAMGAPSGTEIAPDRPPIKSSGDAMGSERHTCTCEVESEVSIGMAFRLAHGASSVTSMNGTVVTKSHDAKNPARHSSCDNRDKYTYIPTSRGVFPRQEFHTRLSQCPIAPMPQCLNAPMPQCPDCARGKERHKRIGRHDQSDRYGKSSAKMQSPIQHGEMLREKMT